MINPAGSESVSLAPENLFTRLLPRLHLLARARSRPAATSARVRLRIGHGQARA
jgi:hypothetical protein